MKLIETDTNWADEMDIWGFETMSEETYDVSIRILNYYFDSVSEEDIELWIGTNEQVFFNKEFLREFIVTDITPQQKEQLIIMFKSSCCGKALFHSLVETALDIMSDVKDKMYNTFNTEFNMAYKGV